MLKLKTKQSEAPAPFRPSPLVRCSLDERRNGWSDETLTAYLRNAAEHEVSFAQERLVRARHRAQQAAKVVEQFKAIENLRDPAALKALARLERLAYEASCDATHAEALFDCALEEAA